jgi:hypothetical protein
MQWGVMDLCSHCAGHSLTHTHNTHTHTCVTQWNGDPDNLIDRFDVRCMLDFYREPPSASTNEHVAAGDPKLLQASKLWIELS